jgi:hypothetical protein
MQKAAMPSSDYLRRQAETCLRIARGCFDLASAERLRHLAGDLKDKASEIERRNATAAANGHDPSAAAKPDYR